MNNVTLIGRLTEDPEIRTAKNKDRTKVANFCLAVYRDKDTTDFLNCVAFSSTAELIEKYFKKGLRVAVSGSVNIDVVTDKHDSSKKLYFTKILVRNAELCQSKSENSSSKNDPSEFVDSDGKPPWE